VEFTEFAVADVASSAVAPLGYPNSSLGKTTTVTTAAAVTATLGNFQPTDASYLSFGTGYCLRD